MRATLSLLILVLTLTTSGISASIATMVSGDEDCCPNDSGDADGERHPCPPLCHACPCAPMFAVPQVIAEPVPPQDGEPVAIELVLQPPVSPPGPGVFHPPRTV